VRDRVLFMGTPPFAVPSLVALAEDYDVVAVVTQPDRPARRGRRLTAPAVKRAALSLGLPVFQPASLREQEAIAQLRELKPRLIVVAAYGQILRLPVLSIPPAGVLNVHPSLLPKYRGASPIVGALLAGEDQAGVTIMLMDEGMDTGPIIAQRVVDIAPEDTAGTLRERLSEVGAELLVETVPRWLTGTVEARPQDEMQASYTKLVTKEEAVLVWSLPALDIWRRVRAYNPRPGARTYWGDQQLKILQARPETNYCGAGQPGEVVELSSGPAVVCGRGVLLLEEVQLAGKRAMDIEDFVRGQRDFVGARLGEGP
jgi:methionyl-tRNA formyltransferase